jgi:signal transduction histidine kinase
MNTTPDHVTEIEGYLFPEPIQIQGTVIGEYLNTFIRGMTHKLNNFLAVIQGFSGLILMTDDLDPMVKENINHMKEAGNGAGILGERILSCSGNVRVNLAPLTLQEYVPMVQGNLTQAFTKLNIPCQVNVHPQTPAVVVDNGRFKEILQELVNNAAEAAEAAQKAGQQGAGAIDVLPPGNVPGSRPDCVDIFIRNTGTPPAERLKEIFKPFVSTKDSKHFGIGLTIVQMICAQMGIRMGLKAENNTTTVWLSVPTK